MARAWLGLGGNIGDVLTSLKTALRTINDHAEISVSKVSSVYRTPPWGLEDQPWFHNCCAEIETSLLPEELLELCQAVERAGNRVRKQRWGPRTIDVDILTMEGVNQIEQRLTIPHPRMLERSFVLVPLAELSPDQEIMGKSVLEHLDGVGTEGLDRLDLPSDWWK